MGLYDKRIESLKTVEEAISFQRELKQLQSQMVGSLYPSILQETIDKIDDKIIELKYKKL